MYSECINFTEVKKVCLYGQRALSEHDIKLREQVKINDRQLPYLTAQRYADDMIMECGGVLCFKSKIELQYYDGAVETYTFDNDEIAKHRYEQFLSIDYFVRM